jgi:hypothetical protein
MAPEVSGDLTPKIIDFELCRKELEKGFSEDGQPRATHDRLQLLLTKSMFFSLCVRLVGLSQF